MSSYKDTKTVAQELRSEQLTNWLNNERSVDDVFRLLNLRGDGFMALMSPKLGALKDYIKAFNREKSADESLLKVMTNGFGGEREYAKFLVKAQLEVVPGSAARSFQTALFNQWLQRNIDPEMLLKNLRLDRGMEDVLADTNLVTLSTYIPVYNARNPNRKTSLIGTLSAHYGDKEVVNALYINRDDSRIDSLVVNLQRKQLAWWLENEKSADDVFSLLKIESDDFSPTKGQTLAALGEFVALLNAINPQHQTNVFAVLQNRFGGDGQLARVVIKALDTADSESVHSSASAASRYRKALFSRWFDNNIKPKDIYLKVLKVNEASAGTLEKSIVTRYSAFYDKRMGQVYTFNNPRRL